MWYVQNWSLPARISRNITSRALYATNTSSGVFLRCNNGFLMHSNVFFFWFPFYFRMRRRGPEEGKSVRLAYRKARSWASACSAGRDGQTCELRANLFWDAPLESFSGICKIINAGVQEIDTEIVLDIKFFTLSLKVKWWMDGYSVSDTTTDTVAALSSRLGWRASTAWL